MRSIAIIVAASISLCGALLARAENVCAQPACGLPASSIESYPQPAVISLPPAEDELNRRDFRRIYADLPIYSAPNGERSIYIGGGLLYVSVLQQSGGWSRIGVNQWVRSEILSNRIRPSRFAGLLLDEDFSQRHRVAWTLQDLRGAATANGIEAAANTELPRYTPVNIYATASVDGEVWHQIGADRWAHNSQLAQILPVARPAEITTETWIGVDLSQQVAIAFEGDQPVFATLISSGMDPWPTNEGSFQVYARYTSALMAGGGYSDYYYLQDVPYAMYFDESIAFHGAYWHDAFGAPRSHGCVNMSLTDARWLYNWMQSEYDYDAGDLTGPDVFVYSSGDED